jgi:EAL domain-containing protein (putative c-di-GMP-specific phosphodiesterase class I)/FixJ family two-component response regulator
MKMLLLDDDPFALALLTRQLSLAGHDDVVGFLDAEQALKAVGTAAGAIELLFCDLQMPGMDGVEFVRHLVAQGYAGGLVLVSGEEPRIVQTVQKLAAAHQLRVLGALAKPVLPAELRVVLGRAAASLGSPKRPVHEPIAVDELRAALVRGELINHYQPKVDLRSGEVVGVESLVRWTHPTHGLVFPDRFVQTAEQHGLIDALTATVLRGALGQARRWRDEGTNLHVAINVSMDNLRSLDFPDFVAAEARGAGVPLTSLILEVTESRLMTDPLAPLEILARLRLKHIGLAIDDFGTGHSSLSQLRDIPFDELKVDRGFIHGAHRDSSLRAIVEASVAMARQMGIRTVAEGVEDEEDWCYVRRAGFDMAQGYYIAKPMPGAQVTRWIADRALRCATPVES